MVDHNYCQLLHYSNAVIVGYSRLDTPPVDVVCQKAPLFLVSKRVIKRRKPAGCIGKINLDTFEDNEDNFTTKGNWGFIYNLAISEGFVFAACSDVIIKFDHDGNAVQQYPVDTSTYSVAINNSNEIISSSCRTNIVTVMSSSGEKLFTYSSNKLRFPRGLDVNFSGNIFVVGGDTSNIHVLTPKAELLKIFTLDWRSPSSCIKFKKNSNICFVGFYETKTKVYEFL